jgi:ubiquinone biosynthesis protein
MDERRAVKIERAVAAAVARWPGDDIAPLPPLTTTTRPVGEVVRPMPRRKQAHVIDSTHVTLPMARRTVFKASTLRAIMRLLVWIWACLWIVFGNLFDLMKGRASVQRRARRLREVLERTGASAAKLGQQLSLRADILPYAYCAELSKMLDRARPFPTDKAIATIERNLGRKMGEMFEQFDPDPIGSASLACVYQARLKTGERVAVKVRRPGIGPTLAADLRVLDWLLVAAETLTFIRPGLTRRFRHDLRTMLLGELNFRAEARYTEMFRIRSEKHDEGLTAPRIYFDYCGEEVMVSDLVSGVWMWELIAAVDSNDQEFLMELRSIGIDPKLVARRLTRAMHRELLEELFFHADPHPANLVVLPDSRICFIDFGAIGRFSTQTRNTWRELHYHIVNNDVARMVNCSINLAGPVPPLEVHRALKAMEEIYADWIYAKNSTDAEWWERSSAQNWLRYIGVAREFGIPVSLEILQFFRATLLYDSIIMRLDRDLDIDREWKEYARRAGKAAKKRIVKQARKRMYGPTNMDYLRLEQMGDSAMQFLFRLQRSVEEPIVQFRNIVGKIAYGMSMLLRLGAVVVVIGGTVFVVDYFAFRWFGREISWSAIADTITSSLWFTAATAFVALLLIRRILLRVNEPDHKPEGER